MASEFHININGKPSPPSEVLIFRSMHFLSLSLGLVVWMDGTGDGWDGTGVWMDETGDGWMGRVMDGWDR